MPYGEPLPSDSGSKKFQGVMVDNAGVNEFQAVAGVNRRTQNAEVIADESVHVTTTSGAGKTIGDTADAAVTTDANGTLSSKLRGLIVLVVNLLTRWPAALGQAAMAASLPVVVASNQTVIPVSDNAGSLTVDPSGGVMPVNDNGGTLTVDPNGGVMPVSDNASSLTVDSGQLPASLGQKAMAASFAAVLASDQSAVEVKTDTFDHDAPGSSWIMPAGALFKAQPVEAADIDLTDPLADGQMGRLRVSERRVALQAPDGRAVYGNSVTVARIGDITVSADLITGAYGAPSTATFAAAVFGGATNGIVYFRIPLFGWRDVSVIVHNDLNQNISVLLYSDLAGGLAGDVTPVNILDQFAVLPDNQNVLFQSAAVGGAPAGNIRSVPALVCPRKYLIVAINPGELPSSGSYSLVVARRS